MKSIIELSKGVRDFYPGYFALVMATGIVGISCQLLQFILAARFFFFLNVVAYLILWALTFWRAMSYPDRLWADLISHVKGPTFLTVVAATCILGSQFSIIVHSNIIATYLWVLGILLWMVLLYTFLAGVTVKEPKPQLENALSGAWLIIVVSTQSISVLGSILAPQTTHREYFLFVAMSMYLVGCMLYLPIISLIFYRWTFFPMSPIQLTPPYWINMGALAITTLAGSRLILNAPTSLLLLQLSPFLKGFTLFFWATGTWWIPLLIILGAWRHIYKHIPLAYDPQYWGMVFPLGMYTAATLMLGKAISVPELERLSTAFIYVAILAWLVTFSAMAKSIMNAFRNES
jgi:tellurite resistance protein TehA-like permease